MKTQLLIIKAKNEYFRFLGQSDFTRCSFDKASVYPLGDLSTVQQKIEILKNCGVDHAEIMVLTITEEKLQEQK